LRNTLPDILDYMQYLEKRNARLEHRIEYLREVLEA
jgi:hypothetical protein